MSVRLNAVCVCIHACPVCVHVSECLHGWKTLCICVSTCMYIVRVRVHVALSVLKY